LRQTLNGDWALFALGAEGNGAYALKLAGAPRAARSASFDLKP